MEIGKIPSSLLGKLIEGLDIDREEVLVGSGIGRDTAILDLDDSLLVLSTDPITGASQDIGSLAVHVSVNDLATVGAEPVALMLTLLAPPGTKEEEILDIMKDARQAAEKLRVQIVGGHSEITDGVNRIILSASVIGKLERPFEVKKIKSGDVVAVSKSLGIEGTSIIAKEKPDESRKILSDEEYAEALSYHDHTSVVKEGLLGKKFGAKYMHDITEGGVLGALWESAMANSIGILADLDEFPLTEVSRKICQGFDIDPYKLISSGSMLIIIDEKNYPLLKEELAKENIDLHQIGIVTEDNGAFIDDGGNILELDSPETDELYSIFNIK